MKQPQAKAVLYTEEAEVVKEIDNRTAGPTTTEWSLTIMLKRTTEDIH